MGVSRKPPFDFVRHLRSLVIRIVKWKDVVKLSDEICHEKINYVSMLLPILDQLSNLVSNFTKQPS